MNRAGPVRSLSVGVVACGIAVCLSASDAAGLPTVQEIDRTGSPVIESTWESQGVAAATAVTVPANAIFEFAFGQASATGPPERLTAELSESWTHPLPTGRLLSQYGNRGIIPGVTTSAFHNGIDLAAPLDTQILAAGSGTVTYAADGNRVLGLSGWVIVIEHLDGTSTAYNHMYESGVLVEVGDSVSAGDVIGLVGSAGNSTGPHLHFSTWVDGRAVNPVNYLQERGVEVPGGRASEGESVFGDPYQWDWGDAPLGDGDPIDEPLGTPEPDPVEQQPSEPVSPDETPRPAPTPSEPPTEDPSEPPTEDPSEPPTEDPTEPPTEDPTEPPTEDPTEDPTEETPTPDPSPTTEPSDPPSEDPSGAPSP